MKNGSNIQEFGILLNKAIASQVKVQTHWCKVLKVDWEEKLMDVEGIADELPFYNVQLGQGSFYRKPKIDSICLIGIISGEEGSTFLIDATQFEEAIWISGESTMTIQEEGFIFKQSDESLRNVLGDFMSQFGKLCDELNKVVVSIGTTPNIPVIEGIKNQVETQIKDRLNNILIG
ncbi:hypothetical protein [Pseudotenacibaculum haliotis]|uniref:Uncharacterized protein n=1 Tax=Pseudotenacibaculum haliotis TaxID=1862138 RepID=A0ABW5LPG9_9FLAO